MQNISMKSLVIFSAVQEQWEWSCLDNGLISTIALRSLASKSIRIKEKSRSNINDEIVK